MINLSGKSLIVGMAVLGAVLVGCGEDASDKAAEEAVERLMTQAAEVTSSKQEIRWFDVPVTVTECNGSFARGNVSNFLDYSIDVYVGVHFNDGNGVQLDDGLDSVRALAPGGKAQWEAPFLGRGNVDRCVPFLSSVFPAN